ncbi:MAG: molybdopterin oxidoreductase family protein [Anaerolineae bacterium]|nr:molybdopterin oxidoreductase family protein [Anaerolineae bacterium]
MELPPPDSSGIRRVVGACPHDCPDTCSWVVTVQDGKAVDLRGNPDHPITRGFLCTKVDRYIERVYHPGRVLHPLRRVGAKGAGKFARITWDEALDEVASRFLAIAQGEYGPQAILPYSYAGTMGFVQGQSMDRRFFHKLGASLLVRTICSTAGTKGYKYTVGASIGTPPEAFAAARFILIWGSNILTSNVHLWPFIMEARKQGARVVCIDPVRTRTAAQSDRWLPIRPGTDAALALAMMHVIFAEGLEDRDYIEHYCLGGDLLRERVAEWAPERAAPLTGLPAEEIAALARDYATTRPAVIRVNYGLQRHAGGGMAMRTISCLPAVVGAWRDHGGGIQLNTSGAFPLNTKALECPDLIPPATRALNMIELGRILNEVEDPPVMALCIYNSNPAAVAPDQEEVVRGLKREDLFTVVLEQFLTDTTDYADIVLPATTQFEHWDLNKPYGHYYLQLNQPAIAPLGECKPNSEVFRLLAYRLGFTDAYFEDSDTDLIRQALASNAPALQGITFERLLQEGFARLSIPEPFIPFAEGRFPTPSGKCEFYSAQMARDGFDPLPAFTPPRESAESAPGLAARYPLACVSPPAHYFLNSTFVNVDHLRRRVGEPELLIHPEDADDRGIATGDMVRIFNDRGTFTVKARVTEGVRPGVVMAPGVWWGKLGPDGRNIHRVTSQAVSDMAGGATFYDCLVEVEAILPSPLC